MSIERLGNNKAKFTISRGYDLRGKRIRYFKTVTYKSERDLQRQYRLFESEVDAGLKPRGTMTVKEMCDDYIKAKSARGVKQTTVHGYKAVTKRIVDTLGNPRATKIKPTDIDNWVIELAETYSPKTITNTVTLLSSAYNRAIKLGEVSSNPCSFVEIPKREKKEPLTLDANTIGPFVEMLEAEFETRPDCVVAIELALFCGLRISEILGLKLEDVQNGKVRVHRTRHTVDSQDVVQDTKTASSARNIALPVRLQEHIASLCRAHETRLLEYPKLEPSDYLILDDLLRPVKSTYISNYLRRTEIRYNLPLVSPHKLRHTHASMLKYFGHDLLEISNQLGHADKTTTLNIYTHLFTDASASSRQIAQEIDRLISRTENPKSHFRVTYKHKKTLRHLKSQRSDGGERGI